MKILFYLCLFFCVVNVWGEEKVYHINTGKVVAKVTVEDVNLEIAKNVSISDDPALAMLAMYLNTLYEQVKGERNFEKIKKYMRPNDADKYYLGFDESDPFKIYNENIREVTKIYQKISLGKYTIFTAHAVWRGNKMMIGYIVQKFQDGYFLVPDASFNNDLLQNMSAYEYDMDKVAKYYQEKLAKGEIFDEFDPALYKVDTRVSIWWRSIRKKDNNIASPDRVPAEEKAFLEKYGEVLIIDGYRLCFGIAEKERDLAPIFREARAASTASKENVSTILNTARICHDMPQLRDLLFLILTPASDFGLNERLKDLYVPVKFRNLTEKQEKLLEMNRKTAQLFTGKLTLAQVEDRAINRYINALYREKPSREVYEAVYDDMLLLSEHQILFKYHYFLMGYLSGAFEFDGVKLREILNSIPYEADTKKLDKFFPPSVPNLFFMYQILRRGNLSNEIIVEFLKIFSEQFGRMKVFAVANQWYDESTWKRDMENLEEFLQECKITFKLPDLAP